MMKIYRQSSIFHEHYCTQKLDVLCSLHVYNTFYSIYLHKYYNTIYYLLRKLSRKIRSLQEPPTSVFKCLVNTYMYYRWINCLGDTTFSYHQYRKYMYLYFGSNIFKLLNFVGKRILKIMKMFFSFKLSWVLSQCFW